MGKHVCKDKESQMIMECRKSGLSDYQWCKQKGIHLGKFYNWVSKLLKQGFFHDSEAKSTFTTSRIFGTAFDLASESWKNPCFRSLLTQL